MSGMAAIAPLRDLPEALLARAGEEGGLRAVLVDLTPLARIERGFGAGAYRSLVAQIEALMLDLAQQVDGLAVVARDDAQADRFLLFPQNRPRGAQPFVAQELRLLADRVEEFVNPRLTRLLMPYLRERLRVRVGYGYVVHNPMESGERHVKRLVEDALDSAALRARLAERREREALLDVVFTQGVWTVFQKIVEMETRHVVGWESLARGPRGTELEPPLALFALAARYGLTDELERCCRRQGFRDWHRFNAGGRLFVNTVPGTVRDPSFMGHGVIDYLGPNLSPRQVTLEITEREVIENFSLYREAMHSFQELGFTFAIDDVGAGYSGLETIANVGAAYLKVDMSLVRDIHHKKVSRQIVKAIVDMGHGVGSEVIAEGIQTEDEAQALLEIGIRYGQGYLYGRPVGPESPSGRYPPQS